jgi:hypothetical protein
MIRVQAVRSPKTLLKSVLLLSVAMSTAVFLFIIVAIVVVDSVKADSGFFKTNEKILVGMTAIGSFGILIVARTLYFKRIAVAKKSLNLLTGKLTGYRNALTVYLACCEGPALVNTILFMFSGHFIFLSFAGAFLGCMLAALPLKRRVVASLDLDWNEQKEFDR